MSVCFKITGEFITQHARELVCEGEFDEALDLFISGVVGLTHEQAYAVLRGEQQFVGTNDISLVDEVPEVKLAYLERLFWLYSGLVLHKRKCYRPYAYVDNWGKEDTKGVTLQWQSHRFVWCPENGRSLYYANHGSDLVKWLNITKDGYLTGVAVLWERVPRPPLGLQIGVFNDTQWQEAVDEYMSSGCYLEHRGNHEIPDDPKISLETPKAVEKQEEEWVPSLPQRDFKFEHIHGYVLADGSYYTCEYSGHRDLAYSILYHIFDKKDIIDPDKELDELNVVKTTTHYETGKPIIYSGKRRTEPQLATLLEWALNYKADLSLLDE